MATAPIIYILASCGSGNIMALEGGGARAPVPPVGPPMGVSTDWTWSYSWNHRSVLTGERSSIVSLSTAKQLLLLLLRTFI